jgi:flagellar hook-associated protein 2
MGEDGIMISSIPYSLGIGSGLDTKTLIDNLTAAAKAPQVAILDQRQARNSAKVSALAQASSAIDGFASALTTLIAGGTLFTQPTVSDPTILTASAIAGQDIGNLSAQVEVRQLAKAQSLVSQAFATSADPVGQGDLTLTTSAGAFTVTIDASNDSLDGLAKAINDAGAGVTASVLTDQYGSRLMLKGATGEASAFTLGVAAGTATGLERFTYDPAVPGGLTAAQLAQDAVIALDGVEVRGASNSFDKLLPGVEIDLQRAAPGTTLSLGIQRPGAAISQALDDFVSAYNELQKMLADATAAASADGTAGPLRGDAAIRDLQRRLGQLTSTSLSSGTGPRTLAEIGVSTNRDGTLSLNKLRLQDMLARDPDGVEALFNPQQYSSDPLVGIFSKAGAAKPGTYQLTNLVPQSGTTGATGSVDGTAMISSGPNLIAPATSAAVGLVVTVEGPVASATVTVDPGLGGALQAMRDAVRAQSGAMAQEQDQLAKEALAIAADRDRVETRSASYYSQLTASFAAMERQVSQFKATQSYLDQQVKLWTSGSDS